MFNGVYTGRMPVLLLEPRLRVKRPLDLRFSKGKADCPHSAPPSASYLVYNYRVCLKAAYLGS
jgi:hypothetical protein